jgi:hypothetical protein
MKPMPERCFLVLVIASVPLLGAANAWASDACAAVVPDTLRVEISEQYPKFRLPRQSDYDAEDIKYNLANGGKGCLGVAHGAYYHEGAATDYAINLTSAEGAHTVLIVAHAANSTWRLERVWDWGNAAARHLYVDTTAPGKYERTEALDGPVTESGERESYTSKLQGIVAGTIESSGAAFFFDGNAWIHVWISD